MEPTTFSPPSAHQPHKIPAWSIQQGWHEADHPILAHDGSWDDVRRESGFEIELVFGDKLKSIQQQPLVISQCDDKFLIELNLFVHPLMVLTPDLPSLMEFLRLYAGILSQGVICW